ncbi:hypothetical protein ZWY2020_032918 [Hordeum vulgare]|nr:hypothetical protein ZWY2020_032918 [Hordeum vulgare]
MAIEGDLPTAYDIPGIARVCARRPLLVLRRSLQMETSFGRIPSLPSSFVSTPSLPSPPLGFAALPCPCIGFVLLDSFSFRKKERDGADLQMLIDPAKANKALPPIWSEVLRFFTDLHKPTILALSRLDPKKNITTLLKAYGKRRQLRELANLVTT